MHLPKLFTVNLSKNNILKIKVSVVTLKLDIPKISGFLVSQSKVIIKFDVANVSTSFYLYNTQFCFFLISDNLTLEDTSISYWYSCRYIFFCNLRNKFKKTVYLTEYLTNMSHCTEIITRKSLLNLVDFILHDNTVFINGN